jgi:hypothetical protein
MNYFGNINKSEDFPINCIDKKKLFNMHNAITQLNLWNKLQTDKPPENKGYMFCNYKWIHDIFNTVENDGHSGASGAYCLRIMEQIADIGWDNFVKKMNI